MTSLRSFQKRKGQTPFFKPLFQITVRESESFHSSSERFYFLLLWGQPTRKKYKLHYSPFVQLFHLGEKGMFFFPNPFLLLPDPELESDIRILQRKNEV